MPESKDPARSASAIVLTGRLAPGVGCPQLMLDDGRSVALSHMPSGTAIGQRVTVRGSGWGGSMSCMQEVLLVESATPAP